mmetsp:Transcript_22070/g.69032  ORF Transcript_22070/g.69032 Transcript_22070/m.69032 type:complete len:209 (+) Transcript_22070:2461-3087(+)
MTAASGRWPESKKRRRAKEAARRTRAAMSAPVVPSGRRSAMASRAARAAGSRRPERRAAAVWSRRICRLAAGVGGSTRTASSKRPGLRRAGSRRSRRLVVAKARVGESSATPSMMERSWLTMESRARSAPALVAAASERVAATASISSMTTQRTERGGSPPRKRSRMFSSLAPRYLSRRSGAATILGAGSRASAIFRARSDLPQPGGP